MSEKDGISVIIENRWMIVVAIVLLFILGIFGYIVLPLLDGIILGLVFAYIARPIKHWLERRGVGEQVSVLVATVAIVAPIMVILGLGMVEIINQLIIMAKNQQQIVNSIINFINELDIPEPVYIQIKDAVSNLSSTIIPMLGQIPFSFGMKLAFFTLNVLISVFVCFFLLKDGSKFVKAMVNVVPADKLVMVESFRDHLDYILAGIFLGNIYAAIITSILSVGVFYVFDVPHIPAMSALILLAGLIPIFAGWMVLGPIAILRYFEFGLNDAVSFMVVSAVVLYAPTELLLKPYIVSRASSIHPLLVMLAFIGGGLVGGIGGFFMAPIFLGTLIAAYRAYMDVDTQNNEIFMLEDI
ncbi:MAG: AI-2E family transporter [ANME-2 cluster archaeon]|nr:AI-2E family transporter [ANME-2 cluster archaeon]